MITLRLSNALAALAATLALSCATAPAPVATRPAPAPAPAREEPHVRHPNALRKEATPSAPLVEPVVRVGLASDLATASFARVDGGYEVRSGAATWTIVRGFTVHAPLASSRVVYAIQVGAISDKASAERLAERVRKETGLRADLVFDTAVASYKVLAGDFADEPSSQPTRSDLIAKGWPKEIFAVRRPSSQPFVQRLRLVDDEGDEHSFDTGSLLVVPREAEGIAIAGKQYRGGARVFLNTRGTLNLVNELNLEDYVRGVVPNEMGPNIFDQVEALKAQAIAARTYVVSRRGEYATEGFDICATPSCQVYGGKSTEHPLSDRAVKETAGLVITYDGKPIDALYTSTCGGETSDVGVMFPGRSEPYLKRARCVELEAANFEGRQTGAVTDESGMRAAVMRAVAMKGDDVNAAWSASQIARAVSAAGSLAGITPRSSKPPKSSRRRDVLEYLGEVWGLDEAARVLLLDEDLRYLMPGVEDGRAARVAAVAVKFEASSLLGLDLRDLDAAMTRDELFSLLYGWLRNMGIFNEFNGNLVRGDGRLVVVKSKDSEVNAIFAPGTPLFRKLNDRFREERELVAQPGDRATLFRRGDAVVGVVLQENFDGAAFDNRSSFSSWVRTFTADELVASISRRNPISELHAIRILGRDASQRATAVEIEAEGGRTFKLEGLPIRWSLGIPDNLFVFDRLTGADGVIRYTFLGKGWGHGVGFCQNGSQGMALRGAKADAILKNYYSGVAIVPMGSLAAR
ncbi:MAG: SpoIID/LytB domain-containing protein [Thermoanaerobaculia bacterium]|jgi:stage II sporulation protein D